MSGRFASQHRSLTTTEQGGDAQSPAQPRAPSIVRKTRSCPSWQRKDPETEFLSQKPKFLRQGGGNGVLMAHRGGGNTCGSMLDTDAKPRPGSQGRSPRPVDDGCGSGCAAGARARTRRGRRRRAASASGRGASSRRAEEHARIERVRRGVDGGESLDDGCVGVEGRDCRSGDVDGGGCVSMKKGSSSRTASRACPGRSGRRRRWKRGCACPWC